MHAEAVQPVRTGHLRVIKRRSETMSKAKTYRAVLIDAEARSVSELQSDLSLATIHQIVNAETLGHFRVAQFEGDLHGGGFDFSWVDDHSLERSPVNAFLLSFSKDPIAGRCLSSGPTAMARPAMPACLLRSCALTSHGWG